MVSVGIWSASVVAVFASLGCVPASSRTAPSTMLSPASDTVEARRVFEENIDAIHKRNRVAYLATKPVAPRAGTYYSFDGDEGFVIGAAR